MDDKLILTIENEAPLPADSLGELFTAFARDYRDLTRGRTLVVAQLEQGSTIIEWTDAVLATAAHYFKEAAEIAKAIKSLADLASTLKSLLGSKKKRSPAPRISRRRRKKPGERSVEAIAKIAAESGCHVRLKRTTPEGEMLEFELTPTEARTFRDELRLEQEANPGLEAFRAPIVHGQGTSNALPMVTKSIERLYQAGDGALSPTEIDQIAETLVGILKGAGLSSFVEKIASGFEMHGLHQVAWALRQKASRSSNDHGPP